MSVSSEAVPRPRSYYNEPQWIGVGDLDVAYRRKGTGEPTLFLHGAGFTRMWLPFHEWLSQSVDLIAPEHPGYGATEMPDWLEGFEDLVLHYDDLLDAFGLETVHLVGYSLGGWIAATFFLRSDTLYYLGEVRSAFAVRDFLIGLGKSVLFSFVIAIIAADEGLHLELRAGAIGEAASRAVVFCLLGVLATDTFVNAVFYFIPGLAF